MCFDKTGTLTEDGLDLYGIRSVEMGHSPSFRDICLDMKQLNNEEIFEVMGCC